MVKGFRQIAILTVLTRILGMLRDMAFAYFFGAGGLMDSWAIAFKIPNLTRRLFGDGVAASTLVPIYTEQLHRDPEKAHRFVFSVVTAVFVALSAVTLLGEGFVWTYYARWAQYDSTKLTLALSGVMLPYMVLICVVALLAGILNTHRHFAAPAIAPALLNILIIGALCVAWVVDIPARVHAFIVAGAVLLAGLAQLGIHVPPLSSRGIRLRPAWDVGSGLFRRMFWLMGPMVLGLAATQINTLVDDFMALWLSGSPEKGQSFTLLGHTIGYPVWQGAVSHLFYGQRLYQFPLGVFGISLATAIYPEMSFDAAKRDFESLCRTISRGLRCTIFVALPATAGLLLISRPAVAVILERGEFTQLDTRMTAAALSFYAIGLIGYFAQQMLIRAFYSLQESSVPAWSAAMAVLANPVLNLALVWPLGSGGLAAATALCAYIQVAALIVVLRRRLGSNILAGMGIALRDTAIATVGMAIAVGVVLGLLGGYGDLLMLPAAVIAGIIVYVAVAGLLHTEMLSLLWGERQRQAPIAADDCDA